MFLKQKKKNRMARKVFQSEETVYTTTIVKFGTTIKLSEA
jgi:hypothetical protein